jgi:hypothetical protein
VQLAHAERNKVRAAYTSVLGKRSVSSGFKRMAACNRQVPQFFAGIATRPRDLTHRNNPLATLHEKIAVLRQTSD